MTQIAQQKIIQQQRVAPQFAAPRAEIKIGASPCQNRQQPIEQALRRAEQTSQLDLLAAIEALQRENRALHLQLRIDPLTGVFNRSALLTELESEWQRWVRSGRDAALLLIDLNDFKRINDTYGHVVGDHSLICAADYFAAQLRTTDLVARLGGDEFAILLRDTDSAEAQRVAGKLCANAPLLQLTDTAADAEHLQLNFAIGVAALAARFASVQTWLDAADQAMYRHKRNSRLHLCGDE